jgi:hypothetical protein
LHRARTEGSRLSASRRVTSKTATKRVPARGATFDVASELARAFPGVEESNSYGTRAIKVKGKLIARLKEDGRTLVIRTSFPDRDHLMQLEPKTFFLTDHYHDYPYVLVSLDRVRRAQLAELLHDAWRRVAPRKLVASHDATIAR